jgi:hypothetical protein
MTPSIRFLQSDPSVMCHALQWDGTHERRKDMREFVTWNVDERGITYAIHYPSSDWSSGWAVAKVGDWIVKQGNDYIVVPDDQFEANYLRWSQVSHTNIRELVSEANRLYFSTPGNKVALTVDQVSCVIKVLADHGVPTLERFWP